MINMKRNSYISIQINAHTNLIRGKNSTNLTPPQKKNRRQISYLFPLNEHIRVFSLGLRFLIYFFNKTVVYKIVFNLSDGNLIGSHWPEILFMSRHRLTWRIAKIKYQLNVEMN